MSDVHKRPGHKSSPVRIYFGRCAESRGAGRKFFKHTGVDLMPHFQLSKQTLLIIIQLAVLLLLTCSLCIKSRQAAAKSAFISEQTETTEADRAGKKDYIHWVDFTVPASVMEKALKLDVDSCRNEIHMDWIELLAWLGARYGGDFSRFRQADLDSLTAKLLNGETMESITADMKYYSYYHEAYSAVLGGMVGYFEQETDSEEVPGEKIWVTKYGLKAYSPIAKGFPYSDYDDFGVSRSYGYRRRHLGHDMMGQVGTPVIAVESGYVEALGWNQYGGWRIGIRSFDKKRYYYYAHLRKNYPYQSSLKEGRIVTAGDVIGYLGRTGYSTTENTNNIDTPHLHFGLQLIFDESQKEGNNEIWIDCYELTQFLRKNQSQTVKVEGTKEWTRVYDQKEPETESAAGSPFHSLNFFHNKFHIFPKGKLFTADHEILAAVDRNQKLFCTALTDGHSHIRSDLSEQRIGNDDADRPDDHIRSPAADDGGILSCRSLVGAGFQHGRCGDAVCSNSQNLIFREAAL